MPAAVARRSTTVRTRPNPTRSRWAFLLLCVAVVAGFFAIAFVQASLVAGQQDLDQLRSQIAESRQERAQLAGRVEQASAPETIVNRAESLGMVRAIEPVYLIPVSPAPRIAPPPFDGPAEVTTGVLVAAPETDGSLLAGSRAATVGAESG